MKMENIDEMLNEYAKDLQDGDEEEIEMNEEFLKEVMKNATD